MGQINTTPFTSVAGNQNNPRLIPARLGVDPQVMETDTPGVLPVVVPTVLSLSRNAVQYWQGVHCFFNVHWFPDRGRVTLPFCFFHVIKYSEIRTADISEKRIIMYEPPGSVGAAQQNNPVRRGLMNAVADNVVIKPRQYKMEVIVPFLPFGRYYRQGVNLYVEVFDELLKVMGKDEMTPVSVAWMKEQIMHLGYGREAQQAMHVLDNTIATQSSNFDTISYQSMVNKNSLDAMFERGHIIQMKTWMGNDYKYVIITNTTLEKRGTEDDVWRGELEVRELPILSLAPVAGSVTPPVGRWAVGVTDHLGNVAFGQRNTSRRVHALASSGMEEEEGVEGGGDDAS